MQEGMEFKSNTWVTYLYVLLISIGGRVLCHQIVSSTFEFMHNCYYKVFKHSLQVWRNVCVKKLLPFVLQVFALFFVVVFGIVNSLSGGREICQVVCL